MIIAKTDVRGRPMLILGLSRANMEELMKGHPILKQPEDLRMELEIAIVGGETEQQILMQLQRYFKIEKVEDRRNE